MLAKLSRLASDEMQTFLESHGIGNTELIVDVAHALVTKYGEASAAAACNLYDEIAEKQGKAVRSAEPAETASREKTAGAVYGSLKDSPEGKKLKQIPDRLVKQAAADTMLQNAKRDGAEWAWIPSGDGCAMCMTIASRGWLPASSAQLSGGHASHIHANCKCQFAIRFDKNLNVEGYDPDELKRQYDAAEGSGSRQKINYLRRKQYEKKIKIKSEGMKEYRPIGLDRSDVFSIKRGAVEISAPRATTTVNKIRVSEDSNIKRKGLHTIDTMISEAAKVMGIEDASKIPEAVVISDREMQTGALAAYNFAQNKIYIRDVCGDRKAMLALQDEFACPGDQRSTLVHELFHWQDAEAYRSKHGPISSANAAEYNQYRSQEAKKRIDALEKRGYNITDISKYASDSYKDGDYDETYTEYRTKILLER